MIKGTNKHVIVVRSPEPKMFEEAIFIVRDDYIRSAGSDRQVMEQAQRTAAEYAKKAAGSRTKTAHKLRGFLFAAAGVVAAGAAWFVVYYMGL